ncbi:Protein of unknown function [Pyronema omphalodes CBS 100304]|uniref:Uncharacterized protein n=1 Tax=Pyronema omphalodes (strain CBS 100304) TaxID=1076935 RepID=U4LE70_PYROM|nr:Protein of unknown function [Pyronema omphalodes CBS 100304]
MMERKTLSTSPHTSVRTKQSFRLPENTRSQANNKIFVENIPDPSPKQWPASTATIAMSQIPTLLIQMLHLRLAANANNASKEAEGHLEGDSLLMRLVTLLVPRSIPLEIQLARLETLPEGWWVV